MSNIKHNLTAPIILGLLSDQHEPLQWAFLSEVADTTAGRSRSIDALAVSCWSQAGIGYSKAYEIKISYSDFQNERKHPSKANVFRERVNEFWFAAPVGVIPPKEVPDGDGLVEFTDDRKARITVKPRVRPDIAAWPPGFTAAILRQMDGRSRSIHHSKLFKYAGEYLDVIQFAEKTGKDIDAEVSRRLQKERDSLEYAKRDAINNIMREVLNRLGVPAQGIPVDIRYGGIDKLIDFIKRPLQLYLKEADDQLRYLEQTAIEQRAKIKRLIELSEQDVECTKGKNND